MRKVIALIFAMGLSGVALADEKIDWSLCEKEIKEYHCTGNDHDIWACLEEHDDHLSQTCQKAHHKADELFKKH